jgi:enoyl-CoA hydratase/carnithine racemase
MDDLPMLGSAAVIRAARRVGATVAHLQVESNSTAAAEVHLSVSARGVATIMLDRPRALNSLSLGMCESMTEMIHRCGADPQIKVILVKSSSPKAFSGIAC